MNYSSSQFDANNQFASTYQYRPHTPYQDKNYLNESNNCISNELRVASLECRVETLEKMIKFYDDLINLKNEERKNEFHISYNETLTLFNSKIEKIEYKIDQISQINLQKNKELSDKIDNLYKKIEIIEIDHENEKKKSFNQEIKKDKQQNKIQENCDNSQMNNSNNDILLSNKISEIDALINKNEMMVENIIEEKLSGVKAENERKINEILSLIDEHNKIIEENDFALNELRDAVRSIQNENVDVIKVVSVQTEKIKQIDFVVDQISELKEKMSKLINIFGENQKEEEEFINNYLGGDANGNQNLQ